MDEAVKLCAPVLSIGPVHSYRLCSSARVREMRSSC
jgi:hypothetical protein